MISLDHIESYYKGVNKMATTKEYIEYVCEQISNLGDIQYKKMFGEYMVYVNNKPIITVCDNIAYIKEKEEISEFMKEAEKGFPYNGAKEHYILDIDNKELTSKVILKLEKITPLPKPRKKKNSN